MTVKKKSLKSLRENQEHLPVHGSDASEERPDSLEGKVGKRSVKAELDGEKIANASGQHGNAQGRQIPEEKEEELEENQEHLPVHPSAAGSQIPDKLKEEDEKELEEEDEKELDEESDEELSEEDDKEELEEEEDKEEKLDEEDEEAKLSEEEEKELEEEDEKELELHKEALSKDEELPEEFKKKAATIFEAAVKTATKRRAEAHKKKLAEAYKKKLAAKKKVISEALVDKVDGYLDYVVEEWLKENEVAIETGLKSEITEKFILGLKGLFESHYIEVPAEKTNVLVEQESKIGELEKELNETLNKNVELRKKLISLEKEAVIKKLSEGLTVSDAGRFSELCEGVSFEDAKAFSEKLKVIKETYFPKAPKRSSELDAEVLAEGGIQPQESTSKPKDDMDLIVDSITKMVKR